MGKERFRVQDHGSNFIKPLSLLIVSGLNHNCNRNHNLALLITNTDAKWVRKCTCFRMSGKSMSPKVSSHTCGTAMMDAASSSVMTWHVKIHCSIIPIFVYFFQFADTSRLNSYMHLPSLCVNAVSHQCIMLYKYVTHQLTIASSFYLSAVLMSNEHLFIHYCEPCHLLPDSAVSVHTSPNVAPPSVFPCTCCNWCNMCDADITLQFYIYIIYTYRIFNGIPRKFSHIWLPFRIVLPYHNILHI
jgi:hypothetical protein